MRGLLAALRRKLAFVRSSGSIEISPSASEPEVVYTLGGPSFVLSEKGVEGPLYPSLGDDTLWYPRAPRPSSASEGSAPPEATDKPEESDGQAGTAES